MIRARNVQREESIQDLKIARSLTSLSRDIATTSTDQSLLSVCAYWIDAGGSKREAFIALPRIHSHSSDNIAAVLRSVIDLHGIGNNCRAFQGDCAFNNDITFDADCHCYRINAPEYRLRYLGDVISPLVQTLISGENSSGFKAELDGGSDIALFGYGDDRSPLASCMKLLSIYAALSSEPKSSSNSQGELNQHLQGTQAAVWTPYLLRELSGGLSMEQ